MNVADRALIAGAIIVSMALGLAFMIVMERPWHAPRALRTMAWLQLALVATPIGLDSILLLVTLRVPPPIWLVILVLFAQDVVYGWRLLILIQAHRERKRS